MLENGTVYEKTENREKKQVVFLIGDSIRIGYETEVKTLLSDMAEVICPPDNCRYTQYVLTNLSSWATLCEPEEVCLVQFNCGHWDVAHWDGEETSLNDVETYAGNIRRIIKRLRTVFPNARIVFATTTGMNPDGSQGKNPRTNQEIETYNRAAVSACENNAEVLDLYAVTKMFGSELYEDAVHQTKEGAGILAGIVADNIRRLLGEGKE